MALSVNQITIDIEPFIEFYRRAEDHPLIRKLFLEAVMMASRREAERYELRERMKKQIQQNELGLKAQLDPRQFNGLLYHCGMLDYATALALIEEFADRATGVGQEEEEDDIPMFDTAQMVNLPPVKWLVEGLIPEDSFTLVAGEYGAGKSFVMLDVAFHVALGLDWHGRKVEEGGPVVYMAAEGGRGLQKRIEAWMIHYNLDIDDPIPLYTIPKAVPLTNPIQFKRLMKKIPVGTKLMIIDTLHTFMEGDENNAQDVKPLLDAIRQLTRQGISVAVVHHLNKSGSIRGSNSIPAGADAVFEVKRCEEDNRLIQVHCTKQKDFDIADCPDMYFRMEQVSLETEFGTSVVLTLDKSYTKQTERAIPITPKHLKIWQYINKHPGATSAEIIDGAGISPATWKRGRKQLMDLGLIQEKIRGQYFAVKQNGKPVVKRE
ncbi:MAG: hypothetical protein CW342_15240 [Thermoactinomycetaceae bacterium]|nr:hypothetical protein [Thermoactinomycetaceae bacterium]